MAYKYFPPIPYLPPHFVDYFSCCAEVFYFDVVLPVCFCGLVLLGVTSKKFLPRPRSRGFFPMFPSTSCTVSGLKSLIHFEVIFIVSGNDRGPISFICLKIQVSNTSYWKDDYAFPHEEFSASLFNISWLCMYLFSYMNVHVFVCLNT